MPTDRADLAATALAADVVSVLAALMEEILRSLWKGEVTLDIVAAPMFSGRNIGESSANGRARREMRDLLSSVSGRRHAVRPIHWKTRSSMTLLRVTCC